MQSNLRELNALELIYRKATHTLEVIKAIYERHVAGNSGT